MARHYRAAGLFLAGGDRWRFGDGEMKTRAEYDAEIARLQAERDALSPEVDLSEAVEAYCKAYMRFGGTHVDGLIAAYPHLHKALGAPEPSEAEDREFAWQVCLDAGYKLQYSGAHVLALAAIRAERARARGEKA